MKHTLELDKKQLEIIHNALQSHIHTFFCVPYEYYKFLNPYRNDVKITKELIRLALEGLKSKEREKE